MPENTAGGPADAPPANNANAQQQTTSSPSVNASNEICRIGVKPPVFSKRDPDLYFIQMESQFRNANVTRDQTKYDYVVGSLDSVTLSNVADIVRTPPLENKYEAIKKRLINDFTDSENRKLRRLVQECELGEDKPSQLLRTMKVLSNGAMNDDAIKTLWLGRLPEGVRAVVSIAEGDLDRCAKQADKMMEMGNFGTIAEIQRRSTHAKDAPADDMQSLKQTINDLRREISEIKLSHHKQHRGRSRTPSRSTEQRTRSRSKSQVSKFPHCYYHHRFGATAKKCVKPCSFQQSEN